MAAYEDVLYDDYSFAEAHPARIGAVGALFGLRPPKGPVRVLDIGCGLGGHLLPMAELDPAGEYVGVDLSAPQIALGQRTVEALGLTNARLVCADMRALPEDLGQFDYIVSHGVYSWVPADAQRAFWQILDRHLAPGGIGYVSYNVYPGWRHRGTVRDVLTRLVPGPGAASDRERITAAREVLQVWRQALSDRASHRLAALLGELDLLDQTSDAYLLYEHLAPLNEPQWLGDVLDAATAHGLTYLGDAELSSMFPDVAEQTRTWVDQRAPALEAAEQVYDLLTHRLFRRSLFVRGSTVLDRHLHWRRLQGLWLFSRVTPVEGKEDTWLSENGTDLSIDDPVLARAVRLLVARVPQALPFEHVLDEVLGQGAPTRERAALGRGLLQLATRGMIELRTHFPSISAEIGERPRTRAMARLQASRDEEGAVNLRHERMKLGATDKAVLAHLDGTNTREDLLRILRERATEGPVEVRIDGELRTDDDALEHALELVLDRMRRAAFLVGDAETTP